MRIQMKKYLDFKVTNEISNIDQKYKVDKNFDFIKSMFLIVQINFSSNNDDLVFEQTDEKINSENFNFTSKQILYKSYSKNEIEQSINVFINKNKHFAFFSNINENLFVPNDILNKLFNNFVITSSIPFIYDVFNELNSTYINVKYNDNINFTHNLYNYNQFVSIIKNIFISSKITSKIIININQKEIEAKTNEFIIIDEKFYIETFSIIFIEKTMIKHINIEILDYKLIQKQEQMIHFTPKVIFFLKNKIEFDDIFIPIALSLNLEKLKIIQNLELSKPSYTKEELEEILKISEILNQLNKEPFVIENNFISNQIYLDFLFLETFYYVDYIKNKLKFIDNSLRNIFLNSIDKFNLNEYTKLILKSSFLGFNYFIFEKIVSSELYSFLKKEFLNNQNYYKKFENIATKEEFFQYIIRFDIKYIKYALEVKKSKKYDKEKNIISKWFLNQKYNDVSKDFSDLKIIRENNNENKTIVIEPNSTVLLFKEKIYKNFYKKIENKSNENIIIDYSNIKSYIKTNYISNFYYKSIPLPFNIFNTVAIKDIETKINQNEKILFNNNNNNNSSNSDNNNNIEYIKQKLYENTNNNFDIFRNYIKNIKLIIEDQIIDNIDYDIYLLKNLNKEKK